MFVDKIDLSKNFVNGLIIFLKSRDNDSMIL